MAESTRSPATNRRVRCGHKQLVQVVRQGDAAPAAMLFSQQLKDAVKVAKVARAGIDRAEGVSPSALSEMIDVLMQSCHSLEAVVEAARAEGVAIGESVQEAASTQLEAAAKAADIASSEHSSAVNPGSALEAAIVLARKVGVDTASAELKLADSFFHRLAPSYTELGKAKNVLTLDNDVLDLPELTQESLLNSLKLRFQREVIYTHVGDVVVSVNPFKPTGSVGTRMLSRYRSGTRRELPPHIYGLIARAYNTLLMHYRQAEVSHLLHAAWATMMYTTHYAGRGAQVAVRRSRCAGRAAHGLRRATCCV